MPDLTECDVLQAALQQFYADTLPPPGDPRAGAVSGRRHRAARGLALGALRAPRAHRRRRSAARSAACSTSPSRNAEVAYQARFNENVAANYDALETLRAVLALPSVPRRIECFDISTIQGSETVASMVVCEDGRMKKGEYRKFRIRGSAARALRGPGGQRRPAVRGSTYRPFEPMVRRRSTSESSAAAEPHSWTANREPRTRPRTASLGRLRLDARSRHAPLPQAARERRAVSRPDPDRRRQRAVVGRATRRWRASGSASLVAVGIAKKEELLFTRDREEPIALREDSPALLLIRRIRDEAHRFAVTFHRASRTRRDLRSELDAIARDRAAAAQGAADGLRQPGRRPPGHAGRAGAGGRRPIGRRRAGALLDGVTHVHVLVDLLLPTYLHLGLALQRQVDPRAPISRRLPVP